jgi:pimeloyl-ACP methyl ester carboxylesterase
MNRLSQLVPSLMLVSSCAVASVLAQEASLTTVPAVSQPLSTKVLEVVLADSESIQGRLCLPNEDDAPAIERLVVFVSGTGPATYLNKRRAGGKDFAYFDILARHFNERNVAFFSYSKRGVTHGEEPPYYDEVDREKFRKVVPSVEVEDIGCIVDLLRQEKRLAGAEVVLLGWSEGTIIAAMAAERYPGKIDALMLAGYAHDNLYDIIQWQFSGHGSMMKLNPVFDQNDDAVISQEEYESDAPQAKKFRKAAMQGAKFAWIDANADGELTAEDFASRQKVLHSLLLHNLSIDNEDWIWKHYFRVSVPWLREHFALEPNKTRLTRLDLPISIFHGTLDPNVPVEGVHDLEARFAALGKTNLETHVFEDHDHDLNFLTLALKEELPAGLAKIFDHAANQKETKER